MKSLRTLLLPLLLLALGACAGRAVLEDPAPIAVPTHVSLEQVRQVVRTALDDRGWTRQDAGSQAFVASYSRRSLSARISVTYTASEVDIRYLDSEGLKYKQSGGERYIHSKYNKWIDNLVHDINTRLSRAAH
ncbi:MAG TPA: hypothetical protein VN046_11075 [Stenotrophobium sp.]|jgi:hypothetical protein|nr:hypothetical protein [Stenotrophobium sp.]